VPDSSYSGDPSTSVLDAVRCMLGDIGGDDGNTWILTDPEITYFDSLCEPRFGDPIMTAAVCADIIAGRYAGSVSISADGVSVSADQLQNKYIMLAASLRSTYKTLAAAGGLPIVGGIDAFTVEDRTVKPFLFRIGMDDNIRAGSQLADGGDIPGMEWLDSEPW
jgi:hypothetical protein